MFDLALTQTLSELFAIYRNLRDLAWTEQSMRAAWNASVVVNDPPAIEGPDGFAYLRLNLPTPGSPFASNSMANVAPTCVARAGGVAFFASVDDPLTASQFVLSMGMVDLLLRHDSWTGDPQDRSEAPRPEGGKLASGLRTVTLETSHQVMIGSPSAAFLPRYTARALLHHLREGWGIAEPRVQLLPDPQLRPTRNLVIGRKLRDFPSDAAAQDNIQRLTWYCLRTAA